MRLLTCVFSMFLLATPIRAAEPAKANTLSPAEIADGWILLFDGETTFGWNTLNDSKWTIADGKLAPQSGVAGLIATTTGFGDYHLSLDYQAKAGGNSRILVDCNQHGKPANAWALALAPSTRSWTPLSFTVKGDSIDVDQDNFVVPEKSRNISGAGEATINRGRIALAGNNFVVRNIKLKPLNLKPIFNGKDLAGWKEIPGKKSKFTVTDTGELNVKNGNGDLQSEGQWADFVLQLDVISYGKWLNSGIFFRCLPGEFWSGYEAQIRNQWKGDDRTKPVDYGTGGIYNRQPARKVVSSDKEWFTMTVVAHDKHLATWVNGYQVSDFTDTRPMNRSARNGCKVDKGPISIQGHDPTTNLSFRNIRIAELPKPAK